MTSDTGSNGSDAPNLVFVSSQKIVPASLGGAGAADALCTSLAAQAGHPGHYIAWLGTSTQSATERIGATARGWVRADGKPFADTLIDIVQGKVWYPLRLTESGDDVVLTGNPADLVVVTATNPDGSTATDTCGDFMMPTIAGVSAGLADKAPAGWNANMGAACTDSVRVYCFGTDHVTPVSIVPETTRLAFVTSDGVSGGISGFDQTCANDAAADMLPGTFHAAVATTSASALDRFANGGPWVRGDGVTVIDASGELTAPIALAESSDPAPLAWTGSPSPLTKAPGNAASCFDWTHVDSTQGLTGNITRSSPEGWGGIPNTCNNFLRVYCLQD